MFHVKHGLFTFFCVEIVVFIFKCKRYIVDMMFHVKLDFFCLVIDKLILLFLCANIYLLIL